ncbi:unnamed protein product [Chilo suppressalis]|uniref:SUI1 domain-containing protein n=1 Tax=Chilo suppressalis TaxID=168631 RepID=A0ABN8AUA6_CHISP|nr:hypothetical protein evm_009688 [Chilo suppressalis]CAH0397234.1 unnamed protein product [Chilo suppressalis]
MFAKSYKLKSNNTLKNSEKKHLAQRIIEEFGAATEENVKEIVPVKSNTSCMKVVLHSGAIVNVYVVDGMPMIIEDDKGLVPTVCALWKVPNLVPTLIIHTPVLPKVAGGAPLYLPGVVKSGTWPQWSRGAAMAACTQDNRAAGLVGRATLGRAEMALLAAGICMDTIHVYGDQLCKDVKFNKIERPKLGPACYPGEDVTQLATDLSELSVRPPVEEWPPLGPRPAPPSVGAHQPRVIEEPVPQESAAEDTQEPTVEDSTIMEEGDCETETEDSQQIPSDMDGLLTWCLLTFLKYGGKRAELPLKTNLLYKNHIMPLCPPDRTLDVKKSSYKKLGKFLEAMQQEGLVEVREIEKGVSALVSLHLTHPRVRHHAAPAPSPAPAAIPAPTAACDDYKPPRITEVFCLTAAAMDLFPGLKKGAVLNAADIRAGVETHARTHRLHCDRALKLDPVLARIMRQNVGDTASWEEVMSKVRDSLTAATLVEEGDGAGMEGGGGSRLIKSRLPPITMQVATRAGNKKVTLVSNLEAFGFNLQPLSRACQQAAAAACTLTRSPGAKHDQLLLQGDQTHFIAKLLIEKYGLPKKYVDGADKALKKKK